jgi:hypothetical protein
MQRIESAVERVTRIRRWQEYTHFKVLGSVIQDAGMNRFGTRQARDAWREAINV